MQAISLELFKIADYLIKQGISLNIQDNQGRTALHFAVHKNQPEIVKLLLEHGADKSIEDKDWKTALDYAKEYQNAEIIKILENRG